MIITSRLKLMATSLVTVSFLGSALALVLYKKSAILVDGFASSSRGVESGQSKLRASFSLESGFEHTVLGDFELPGNGTNDKYFQQCLGNVITHDDVCFEKTGERKDIFLIALITSLPSHFSSRQAIRETWGKQREFLGKRTALLFTLAIETKNTAEIQRKVLDENERHGDIIQANIQENYRNLTLKVVFGLKWVTENCPHTKFTYKGDDDTFVNIKSIVRFLDKTNVGDKKPVFWGHAMLHSRHIVNNKSKFYVPESQYKGTIYPPYCSGGGYVISGNVIPAIFKAARGTPLIPMEDAYQGILAKKLGIKITGSPNFCVFGKKGKWMSLSDKCFLERCVVAHKYGSPAELRKAWDLFTNDSMPCTDPDPAQVSSENASPKK